jgi:hypothetical protein
MRGTILLLAVLLLVGCSRLLSPDEITGSYKAVLPKVTIYLELRPDHTYSERLDYADGKHEAASGTWSWQVAGSACADLDNALFPREAEDQRTTGSEKTNWCLTGEKRFGKTILLINDDLGWNFERIAPAKK